MPNKPKFSVGDIVVCDGEKGRFVVVDIAKSKKHGVEYIIMPAKSPMLVSEGDLKHAS
jgi:hypothetical protein